ncbi:hypothetical protein BH09VER1_BH09VER1_22980 [soil metagenome]
MNQSELLFAALQKAGVPSSFYVVKGGVHGGDAFKAKEYTQPIADFLTRYLLNGRSTELTKK